MRFEILILNIDICQDEAEIDPLTLIKGTRRSPKFKNITPTLSTISLVVERELLPSMLA